ncbi:asparagine-linked glycosylation protein, partial [Elasticomyces elasticus]
MGYAFAVALSHWLFPKVPRAAYVHYPTISTDMVKSLDDTTGTKGVNAGAGVGLRGQGKKIYWKAFAYLYGIAGRQMDVVMCNSTWTLNHISQLWRPKEPTLVYPPCPVNEIAEKIGVSEASEKERQPIILYVAQYRQEKNHSLILRSFAKFYHSHSNSKPELVLIGSVRSNTPDERHIYNLRLEARELKVDSVTRFITDAPFSRILEYLQKSTIGVNG